MEEGLRLVAPGCNNPAIAPPIAEVEAWKGRITAFLDSRVGHSYVQRLANLPPGFLTNTRCDAASADFNKVVRTVIETNTHLEQFSQQATF